MKNYLSIPPGTLVGSSVPGLVDGLVYVMIVASSRLVRLERTVDGLDRIGNSTTSSQTGSF